MLWSILKGFYKKSIKKNLIKNNRALNLGQTRNFTIYAVVDDVKLLGKLGVEMILVTNDKLVKEQKELPNHIYPHHFNWKGICSYPPLKDESIIIDLTSSTDINYAAQLFISQQKSLKITKQNNVYAPFYTLKFANASSVNEFLNLSLSYLNKFWNARA